MSTPSTSDAHTAAAPRPDKRRSTGHAVLWARGLLALVGGHAVAAAWAMGLARLLPAGRVDATLIATMAAFVVYVLAAIWAFSAASVARAVLGLLAAGCSGALLATGLAAGTA